MGSLYSIKGSNGEITTAGGINLPSTSGTPRTMKYNCVDFIRFQMTGSVTPFVNFFVTFSRVGQSVTMKWERFFTAVTTTGSDLESSTAVPDIYLPTYVNAPTYFVYGTDGPDADAITNVALAFGSGGTLVITPSNLTTFNSSYCGIVGGSISYVVTSDIPGFDEASAQIMSE
jgi:hypothetical protein